jgi:hypothetical protein
MPLFSLAYRTFVKGVFRIAFPLVLFLVILHPALSQHADSTMQNESHARWLKKLTGTWQVTMTAQPLPEAKPMVVKGIVAIRSLVNNFCLYEIMRPAPGSGVPDFQRISYLAYNFNESRWDYMSIDSRITGGIMFFTNVESNQDSITSYIFNFPYPGFGPDQKAKGIATSARNVILNRNDKEQVVKQYWRFAGGREWRGMLYEYTRKP